MNGEKWYYETSREYSLSLDPTVRNQRLGQYLANKLYEVDRYIYGLVIAEGLDPYYDDSLLPGFYNFLSQNWK